MRRPLARRIGDREEPLRQRLLHRQRSYSRHSLHGVPTRGAGLRCPFRGLGQRCVAAPSGMALSTGVELAMGGQDEDALGSTQYMCIAAMAVTVSSYRLLELGVGPQYGRLCQALIFAICIPLYLGAFDKATMKARKVGLAGFDKFGQSFAVSVESDRRVVLSWVWDAAGKLGEFELTQRCRLQELDKFAAKGDVDVIAVVDSSVLASHGPALVASADLVVCDATPLTDRVVRQRLLEAADRAGRRLHIASGGALGAQAAASASTEVLRTRSKRSDSPVVQPPPAGWVVQLQRLALSGTVSSVELTFTQPIAEVETTLPATTAFAGIRNTLRRRQSGSGQNQILLYEGSSTAALCSLWASALDRRLTHALGCAMLALHRLGNGAAVPSCEPTLRWQVATSAAPSLPAAGSKHPQHSPKDIHKSDDGQESELVVTVVAAAGDSHTYSYTIANSAEPKRKYTSASGIGATVDILRY